MENRKAMRHPKTGWSYPAISRIPEAVRGVYAFWCRSNGKCIYVGKAEDQPIKDRLKAHWRRSHNRTLRLWIEAFGEHLDICFTPVSSGQIERFERRLIRLWRPEANIQHNQ